MSANNFSNQSVLLQDGILPPHNYNDVWDKMTLGQSFTVKGNNERNRARTSFWTYHKRNGRFPRNTKFISRHIGDDIYRIWLADRS